MAKFGKRTTAAREAFADKMNVTVAEAAEMVKTNATAKFDETVEIAMHLGVEGKVLGPRNLMPNPRVGTVTMDVKAAVEAAKGGQVQFKAEKAGVVHAGIGKASFSAKQIEENMLAFVEAVGKAKPALEFGVPTWGHRLAAPNHRCGSVRDGGCRFACIIPS